MRLCTPGRGKGSERGPADWDRDPEAWSCGEGSAGRPRTGWAGTRSRLLLPRRGTCLAQELLAQPHWGLQGRAPQETWSWARASCFSTCLAAWEAWPRGPAGQAALGAAASPLGGGEKPEVPVPPAQAASELTVAGAGLPPSEQEALTGMGTLHP